jgi:hypothetical protein
MCQAIASHRLRPEDLAALRIDARHDVPDSAILAGRVHCLENQQHRIVSRCVMQPLQITQLLDMILNPLLVVLLSDGACGKFNPRDASL